MERIEKSAIIFHCEDNFGENYKYVLIAEIGEEQEVISKERKQKQHSLFKICPNYA